MIAAMQFWRAKIPVNRVPTQVSPNQGHYFRVARLQNKVGTKFLFKARIFSRKCSEFFPQKLSLYYMGSEKSRDIPAKFPCQKPRKIHRQASAGAHGENYSYSGQRKKQQHKYKLFGPNFLRICLTLAPACPGVKKFSPSPGLQENTLLGVDVHDFRRGHP